jgi:hypothetical protein
MGTIAGAWSAFFLASSPSVFHAFRFRSIKRYRSPKSSIIRLSKTEPHPVAEISTDIGLNSESSHIL